MPAYYFRSGDACELRATVGSNLPESMNDIPFVVLLDLGIGQYWFWPSWRIFPPDIDFILIQLDPGEVEYEVIPPFSWPVVDGSLSGIRFHGALLTRDMTALLGDLGSWEMAYGQ